MKKIFILLFSLMSLAGFGQTLWYVATNGSDVSGKGTFSRPWLTLKHATDTIKAGFEGDTIYLKSGTYTQNASSTVAPGISIRGENRKTTILKCDNASTDVSTFFLLDLYSDPAGVGVSGNQSISNLTFDGDLIYMYFAIHIRGRSDITIHHCDFIDIRYSAINMWGLNSPNYAENIDIHNCYFYNASGSSSWTLGWGGTGAISVGGYDGVEIKYDTIISPAGADASHIRGVPINASGYRTKNLKIHHCWIEKQAGNGDKGFSMEIIGNRGGWEVYENRIISPMDINRVSMELGTTYGLKFYKNLVGPAASFDNSDYSVGATMEAWASGVYIYQNLFQNVNRGITIAMSQAGDSTVGQADAHIEDIYINYNVFKNMGGIVHECTTKASTNKIYSAAHGLTTSSYVRFTGTIPGGLTDSSTYYARDIEVDSFRVTGSYLGTAKDITTNTSSKYGTIVYMAGVTTGSEHFVCSYDSINERVHPTSTTHFFIVSEGSRIIFDGTVPSKLSKNTIYFVRNVRISHRDFQISETIDGPIVTFGPSANGSYFYQPVWRNINIQNNVFENKEYGITDAGVWMQSVGTADHFNIENNIFIRPWKSFVYGRTTGMTMDSLHIRNNIVYLPQHRYTPYYDYNFSDSSNLTNYGYSNNQLGVNPLFTGTSPNYFDLQASSPAINHGLPVGLTEDMLGNSMFGLPDIGAYEFQDYPILPVVETTISPYFYNHNNVWCKGNVVDEGGATVTARGFCYSTSINPTIADPHTHNGTGEGAFTSRIENLKAFTKYYFRAFATNAAGTAYGENKTIKKSIMIIR